MKAFAYVTPQSPESAVEFARSAGRQRGRFIAGGIDLLGELKENLAEPDVLVNIKALPGTREIKPGPDQWAIGANVTLAALARHDELRRIFPGLAEAADEVGSPQMRNVATVGGNLAQHSRCWYYRHRDVRCLKNGGPKCYARGGENKYHALFTRCQCLSPCVSNLAVALTVLNATVVVQRGAKAERWPITRLYETAMTNARVHNALQPADLILRVEVPVTTGVRSTYLQMGEKSGFDWALVSCAAAGRFEGGRLQGVRLALGCVAPIPWLVAEANDILDGQAPDGEAAGHAADLILRDARPQEHNAYKVTLAKALIRRALARLAG